MPKNQYQKGTLGKLLIQDWEIVTGYPDVPRLYILTEQQASALVALATFLSWRTRWNNLAVDADIDAFASETMFNLMNPITCEMLTECLQPLFDNLEAKIDAIQSSVTNITSITEAIQQTQADNAAQPMPVQGSEVDNEICGGATGIVDFMDFTNRQAYADQEASTVDNIFEAIPVFLRGLPIFGELPFDELFELVNTFFENQASFYNSDFDEIRDDLICDLKCFVNANDNEFDIDVWADWLNSLPEKYPGNRAAALFSRYSPAALTFLNQIVALINGNQSMQAYFDELASVWFAGMENPETCTGCECPFDFEVPAISDPALDEFDTGYDLLAATQYHMTATGLWNGGAGGEVDANGRPGIFEPLAYLPTEQVYCLMYRVGLMGSWTYAGADLTFTPGAGRLYLAMNDVPGAYSDNTGSLTVSIVEV